MYIQYLSYYTMSNTNCVMMMSKHNLCFSYQAIVHTYLI